MSEVRRNLAANFASRAWTGALGLVFPPIYARYLGLEGYGLIGLYTSVTALFVFIDFGLARTIQRELATIGPSPHDRQLAKDLVRTFEVVFWAVAVVVGLVIAVGAPWIADHWINIGRMSRAEAIATIRLIGTAAALNWPVQMYGQVLLGLQRQVATSLLAMAANTVRTLGAALVLALITRTTGAFFVWTTASLILWAIAIRHLVARSLPDRWIGAKVNRAALGRQAGASIAVWVGSVAAVAVAQADRVVGSRMLPLREFGAYALAVAAAAGLQFGALPVWNAVFPRLCQLATGPRAPLQAFFAKSSELMTVAVMPAAWTLAFFARDVLFAWTGSQETAAAAAPLLGGVVVATAAAGLANIPYGLQIASGEYRIAVKVNVAALVLLIPALVWSGAVGGGAAIAWAAAAVQMVLFVASAAATPKTSLGRSVVRATVGAVLPGTAASLAAAAVLRVVLPPTGDRRVAVATAAGVGVSALLAGVLASRQLRTHVLTRFGASPKRRHRAAAE